MALVQIKNHGANYTKDDELSAFAEVAQINYDPEDNQVNISISIGEKDRYLNWTFDVQDLMEAIGKGIKEGIE